MSDLKLYKLAANQVTELSVSSMALENSLQTLIEKHLDTFLGVTFLASEYSTGPKTGGRMDTLGIDENGAPVIIEYKKATNANVINQGLFYLDWLLDHRGDFELLVTKKLGVDKASAIDWSSPRHFWKSFHQRHRLRWSGHERSVDSCRSGHPRVCRNKGNLRVTRIW
ncbi:MAG: endonuclease NucS [Akkermansiaceae bacterium]|jgi:hypothetical protein|nr:endonuclease NucS [Akkermansiaceae bacterium]